jgi:hypothetical protein
MAQTSANLNNRNNLTVAKGNRFNAKYATHATPTN